MNDHYNNPDEYQFGISLTVSNDGTHFKLNRDEYLYGWTVPEGFYWDGASVPWFATVIIPRAYKTLKASCIHDYLCREANNKEDRRVADVVLFDALRERGFSGLRSGLSYLGVRLGAFFGIGVYYPHWTDTLKRNTP